jgi:hypothetical protein
LTRMDATWQPKFVLRPSFNQSIAEIIVNPHSYPESTGTLIATNSLRKTGPQY